MQLRKHPPRPHLFRSPALKSVWNVLMPVGENKVKTWTNSLWSQRKASKQHRGNCIEDPTLPVVIVPSSCNASPTKTSLNDAKRTPPWMVPFLSLFQRLSPRTRCEKTQVTASCAFNFLDFPLAPQSSPGKAQWSRTFSLESRNSYHHVTLWGKPLEHLAWCDNMRQLCKKNG